MYKELADLQVLVEMKKSGGCLLFPDDCGRREWPHDRCSLLSDNVLTQCMHTVPTGLIGKNTIKKRATTKIKSIVF